MAKVLIKVELRDHVSAAELREMGFPIAEEIPGDWIVPRGSLLPDVDSLEAKAEGDTLHCSFLVQCGAPFRPPIEIEVEGDPEAITAALSEAE
jgi:hypothetical protein